MSEGQFKLDNTKKKETIGRVAVWIKLTGTALIVLTVYVTLFFYVVSLKGS